MQPTFQLARNQSFYYYTFITDEQQQIFFSRYYTSEKECRRGIVELKAIITQHNFIDKAVSAGGSYSFIVRNKKNDILGHSPDYFAISSRDLALRRLITQSHNATIVSPMESCRGIAVG